RAPAGPGAALVGFGGGGRRLPAAAGAPRCSLARFPTENHPSSPGGRPMRHAVRPSLLATALFILSTPLAWAQGGAPDDRWQPGAVTGSGTSTNGNTPGANPGKWNVDDPPGPHHDVQLDVKRGTWMAVDVSPDGKQIVFDMMGDLYVIPIEGGEAKSLTHGMAWDEQPRFSPDGKRIAFTSDRAGGDNIWVMDRDGSHAHQVSQETYRLLNSPTWAPDGEYIAAKKHFTSTRSAGAGEIWMYLAAQGG